MEVFFMEKVFQTIVNAKNPIMVLIILLLFWLIWCFSTSHVAEGSTIEEKQINKADNCNFLIKIELTGDDRNIIDLEEFEIYMKMRKSDEKQVQKFTYKIIEENTKKLT